MHHQLMGQTQAHLKGLLSRDQGSAQIFVTEDLIATPLNGPPMSFLRWSAEQPQIQVDTVPFGSRMRS